jgi:hypothetical protein
MPVSGGDGRVGFGTNGRLVWEPGFPVRLDSDQRRCRTAVCIRYIIVTGIFPSSTAVHHTNL